MSSMKRNVLTSSVMAGIMEDAVKQKRLLTWFIPHWTDALPQLLSEECIETEFERMQRRVREMRNDFGKDMIRG